MGPDGKTRKKGPVSASTQRRNNERGRWPRPASRGTSWTGKYAEKIQSPAQESRESAKSSADLEQALRG